MTYDTSVAALQDDDTVQKYDRSYFVDYSVQPSLPGDCRVMQCTAFSIAVMSPRDSSMRVSVVSSCTTQAAAQQHRSELCATLQTRSVADTLPHLPRSSHSCPTAKPLEMGTGLVLLRTAGRWCHGTNWLEIDVIAYLDYAEDLCL